MGQSTVLLILCMVYYSIITTAAQKGFNVVNYGAVGDGKTDDAKAFSKAWSDTCSYSASGVPTMVIPKGKTFLVRPPLTFKGPCKANNVSLKIEGEIVAPNTPLAWKGIDSSQWLVFDGIKGLDVSGPGRIDGRGSSWWSQSCKYHPKLAGCTSLAPTALRFSGCIGINLNNMYLTNSAQTHILLIGCQKVQINNIVINSPRDSPNTDGIHIQSSQHVSIYNSNIQNGDDCISIGDFNSHIKIQSANCTNGHGISIGSLGKGPKGGTAAQVEDISVKFGHFVSTTNGARIKTWQGGSGYARNISFEQLKFTNVQNPIIIDQSYCSQKGACKEERTGVQLSNVAFRGITGTSSTKVALNLQCSNSVACTGIILDSIQLESTVSGQKLISTCNNAYGTAKGVVKPNSCLKLSSSR